MSGTLSRFLGAILVAASSASTAERSLTPLADSPGVLLLKNGQVIQGHIDRDSDYYVVTLPGQESRVRVSDVEFFCHDLREGYRQKKAVLQTNDVEQHVQLCLWCERLGMFDLASEQLNSAEAIDREHPMISVLRRRLKIEMQQKKELPCLAETGAPPPTDDQLDRMTRGMPPGTVDTFVQIVQPILLNHCPGAVGFTLPGQKRLQLMRPPLGERPSRRITQRNLYAVLECINWDYPGESPLLKASVGPTAAQAVGSFPRKHSPQYDKLVQWVYQVAQKPMPMDETPFNGVENASFAELAGGGTPVAGAARIRAIPLPAAKPAESKAGLESGENNPQAAPAKPGTSSRANGRGSIKVLAEKGVGRAIDSIDPYDPATFNNQANAPTTLPTPAARVLGKGQ
jgi:hypothetical protein